MVSRLIEQPINAPGASDPRAFNNRFAEVVKTYGLQYRSFRFGRKLFALLTPPMTPERLLEQDADHNGHRKRHAHDPAVTDGDCGLHRGDGAVLFGESLFGRVFYFTLDAFRIGAGRSCS